MFQSCRIHRQAAFHQLCSRTSNTTDTWAVYARVPPLGPSEAQPAFVVRAPECSSLYAMSDVELAPRTPHEDGRTRADGTVDPAHRVTLSYIDRSRRYYASAGYETPYRWVTNDSAPFAKPGKPVADSRLAVVTTSFPVERHDGPRPPKSVRAVQTEPIPDSMYTDDVFWHKGATTTDDVESFLPLRTLFRLVSDGRLGSLGERFFCVPTTYSQRSTRTDAESIAGWCGDDEIDLVILIPL